MALKRYFVARTGLECSTLTQFTAENILYYMKTRKLSLSALAKKSGLSKGSLHRFLVSNLGLTLDSLELIAKALNLETRVLLKEKRHTRVDTQSIYYRP